MDHSAQAGVQGRLHHLHVRHIGTPVDRAGDCGRHLDLMLVKYGFNRPLAAVSNPAGTGSDWLHDTAQPISNYCAVTTVSSLRSSPTPSNNYAEFSPVFFSSQFQFCEGEPL
jgi:hypothetical protein